MPGHSLLEALTAATSDLMATIQTMTVRDTELVGGATVTDGMLHAVCSLRDLYTKPDIDLHAVRPLPYTDVLPSFPSAQAHSLAPAQAAPPALTPAAAQRVDPEEPLPDSVPVPPSPQLRPTTPHGAPQASPQRVTPPAPTSTTPVPTYTWIRVHQRHVKGAPLVHFDHVGRLFTDSDGTY
jgi:hypothetical protein